MEVVSSTLNKKTEIRRIKFGEEQLKLSLLHKIWLSYVENQNNIHVQFSSVQSLSHFWLFATPWTAARQASLSITNSRSPTQTHVHWVSDAIQPSHPLSSPFPPALNLSQHQGLFKWVSSSHQYPCKLLEIYTSL